jgi:hypothetical protein
MFGTSLTGDFHLNIAAPTGVLVHLRRMLPTEDRCHYNPLEILVVLQYVLP